MPIYEYVCKKCGKKFSLTMRIEDHDRKKAKCPKCASSQLEPTIQAFFATTSKKS